MRFLKGLKMLVCVVALCVLVGFVVEYLWNWLMPGIFGLRTITYWQAVGLFLLSKILLGGIHRHGGRGRDGRWAWKHRMKERWAQMSPEERERFRAGMRSRRGCRWPREDHEWFRDAESGESVKEKV